MSLIRMLKMSSHIGSCGVTAEGEITIKQLACGLNSIICASDGIWSIISVDDIKDSIKFSTDLAKTAMSIVLNT